MIEFLSQYWHVLIRIALLIIVTLITLFKKKVKVYDAIPSVILEILPVLINQVEASSGLTGEQKLNTCVNLVNLFLKANYPDVKEGTYDDFIVQSIEKILSTPKKKEVSNG